MWFSDDVHDDLVYIFVCWTYFLANCSLKWFYRSAWIFFCFCIMNARCFSQFTQTSEASGDDHVLVWTMKNLVAEHHRVIKCLCRIFLMNFWCTTLTIRKLQGIHNWLSLFHLSYRVVELSQKNWVSKSCYRDSQSSGHTRHYGIINYDLRHDSISNDGVSCVKVNFHSCYQFVSSMFVWGLMNFW